ncbi:hypothetical protein [Halococcus salifodinae]|nr:hypothetical protein [Halococcus salifodinae]
MKGVIRVECAICGPMVEAKDSTMMEASATHHEHDLRPTGLRGVQQ